MVLCFKHPKYDGVSAPDLECRVCCRIFLAHVKEKYKNTNHRVRLEVEKQDERIKQYERRMRAFKSLNTSQR